MSARPDAEIIKAAQYVLSGMLEGLGQTQKFAVVRLLKFAEKAAPDLALTVLSALRADAGDRIANQSLEFTAARSEIRKGFVGIRLQAVWLVCELLELIILDRGRDV